MGYIIFGQTWDVLQTGSGPAYPLIDDMSARIPAGALLADPRSDQMWRVRGPQDQGYVWLEREDAGAAYVPYVAPPPPVYVAPPPPVYVAPPPPVTVTQSGAAAVATATALPVVSDQLVSGVPNLYLALAAVAALFLLRRH